MNRPIITLAAFGLVTSIAAADSVSIATSRPNATADAGLFVNAHRPISNSTLFDLALPTTDSPSLPRKMATST